VGTGLLAEAGGATYWLAEGWLFLSPKQLPIHPPNPLLGLVPRLAWLEAIWAEANPTTVNVNIATATKAIIIFVFCILSPYYNMVMGSYGSLVKQK
jgi:hypothetical protein